MAQHMDVPSRSSGADLRERTAVRRAPIAWPGCAIAAFVLAAITTFSPPAFAQQAQTGSGQSFDLFTNDSVDPDPQAASALVEAARRAEAPDQCPLGSLSIVTPEGDPLFQQALASARRQAVLQLLNNAGIDTGRFFVDSFVAGTTNNAWLTGDLDRARPTLTTTSVPANGSKVKAGDEITVTMVARDDAEPKAWQTGIKTIQLVADSEAGRFLASENYEACADADERRVQITYTVPANPPPIVRLSALAEDHAGLMDTDAAAFPTGDWFGTIKKTAKGGGHNHTIDVDFAFEIETAGTIKGRAHARVRTEAGEVPGCTILWTYEPSEFDIPLSGRRDGESFEIDLAPDTTTATFASIAGACKGGGGQESATFPSHLSPAVYATTKYRIAAQDSATDTVELNAGELPWGVIMTDTLEIRQARQ
jgi:hypothetical protein